MRFLTARFWILPVWAWIALIAIGGFLVIHLRKSASTSSSNATDSPNLTNQPATLYPFSADYYYNTSQAAAGNGTTTGSPSSGTSGQPTPHQVPYGGGASPFPIPLPTGNQTLVPAPKVASVTYPVRAGSTLNSGLVGVTARRYGYTGSPQVFNGQRLVIPG